MTINELQKRKEELGYSNETIAMLSGVSLNAVENLFTDDKVLDITYEEKLAIERVLKVPEDNFVQEAENTYLAKKQGEFTLKDYYAIPDDKRVELIDGVLYDMGAPSYEHQKLVIEIAYAFKEYIKKNKGHCEVLTSPIDVQLNCDDRTMVQPDILIICDKNKINKRCIFGAPDLIVEILSPTTKKKDMSIKLAKYIEAGVREYWIVDPDNRRIIVHNREQEDILNVYGFEDGIPVGIFEGKCEVDFAKIWR